MNARIALATLTVTALSLSTFAGCADDPGSIGLMLENPVVPTVFYATPTGAEIVSTTAPHTQIMKRTPDGLAEVMDATGAPVTWEMFSQPSGTTTLRCADGGTYLDIQADGLLPNAVYTGWLVSFHAPGFMTGGLATIEGVMPSGAPNGSDSEFVTDGRGFGHFSAFTPGGELTVALGSNPAPLPACLVDAYEVHVVLAYHQDGLTCGDAPCAADTVAEHAAWLLVQGEEYGTEP